LGAETFADPTAMRALGAQLRSDVAHLSSCPALPTLDLPGDGGGVNAAVAAFLRAEADVSAHALGEVARFASQLEQVADDGQQADAFAGW